MLDGLGYEWESDGAYDETFWVKTKFGVSLINVKLKMADQPRIFGHAPAVFNENWFQGGGFRYALHGQLHPKLDNVDCIPDYADEKGRKHWPKYVMVRDKKTGKVIREGPQPFGSKAERREYERLTGLQHRDNGLGQRDHREIPSGR